MELICPKKQKIFITMKNVENMSLKYMQMANYTNNMEQILEK